MPRRSGITWVEDTLTPGLDAFPGKLSRAVGAVMQFHEPQVQSYMKLNAPWTDRTTNARNGLKAKYVRAGDLHSIVAFHSVPYGIWLEVANHGKYRIIVPTILTQGREVMKTMRDVLRRMG